MKSFQKKVTGRNTNVTGSRVNQKESTGALNLTLITCSSQLTYTISLIINSYKSNEPSQTWVNQSLLTRENISPLRLVRALIIPKNSLCRKRKETSEGALYPNRSNNHPTCPNEPSEARPNTNVVRGSQPGQRNHKVGEGKKQ